MANIAATWEDLSPEVQRAIGRRDEIAQPIFGALSALDLSWEIAVGNMSDLDRTLRAYEGSGWRSIRGRDAASFQYHRLVLRMFHNFLSASVSTMWHADRIAGRIRRHASALSAEYAQRATVLRDSPNYCLLAWLRDYAVHSGHHVTVLTIHDGTSAAGDMVLVGSVCFDFEMIRLETGRQIMRGRRTKRHATDTARMRNILNSFPKHVEMRSLVENFYRSAGDLLKWFRVGLVDFQSAVYSKPLDHWMEMNK